MAEHSGARLRPYFEGWYFKHQAGGRSLALIPGVSRDGLGGGQAFIQVLTDTASYFVPYPVEAFAVRRAPLGVRVGALGVHRRGDFSRHPNAGNPPAGQDALWPALAAESGHHGALSFRPPDGMPPRRRQYAAHAPGEGCACRTRRSPSTEGSAISRPIGAYPFRAIICGRSAARRSSTPL